MENKEQNTLKNSSYMFGIVKAVIDFTGQDSRKFLQNLNDAGYTLSEIKKEQNTGMSLDNAAEKLILSKKIGQSEEWISFKEVKQLMIDFASWQSSQPINSGWVSVEDSISFAEYFRNNFDYYDCTANGRLYKWIDLRKSGIPAMSMKQIFNEWQNSHKQ